MICKPIPLLVRGKRLKGVVCTAQQSPPSETECREAIYSQGRACKKCEVNCYRQGWSKDMVDRDNKWLVKGIVEEEL